MDIELVIPARIKLIKLSVALDAVRIKGSLHAMKGGVEIGIGL